MNDLISKIQTELPGFSKGQKQIARYILEHYDKAAFMTASRLGVTVGVSESTVVRFATELGYDGYPHLQRALQEMIRNKLTSVQRMEVSSDRLGGRDVLRTVLHADTDMIRQTLDRDRPRRLSGRCRRAHGGTPHLHTRCALVQCARELPRLLFQSFVR